MGIIENFLKARGYAKAQTGGILDWQRRTAEAQKWRLPDYSEFEKQAATYQSSLWVYFCVTRIMEASAAVPYQVFSVAGEEETEITAHPFEQRLAHPNESMSGYELMEATFGSLELTGNAYWYLTLPSGADGRPVAGSEPLEIWWLRSDRMRPVPDPDEWLKGYVYTVDGQSLPLYKDEVVHFKRWHPIEDYIGLSPLEALRYTIEQDGAAQEWNARFFRENAMPSAIVSIENAISDSDYETVVKQWQGKYGGIGNAHKIAFVRGSSVDVKTLGIPHKDMQFLELLNLTQRQIFNIYGIPMGKWSENATEANAKVAERTFTNDTLWPRLQRVSSQINKGPLCRYGDNLRGRFEDIRIPDKDIELAELELILRGTIDPMTGMPTPVMAVDEIRQKYWQLPPMGGVVGLPEAMSAAEVEEAKAALKAAMAQGMAIAREREHEVEVQAYLDYQDDLRKWRDVAVREFKAERNPAEREFVSDVIPAYVKASVEAELSAATTLEEVKAAFAAPFRPGWQGYP